MNSGGTNYTKPLPIRAPFSSQNAQPFVVVKRSRKAETNRSTCTDCARCYCCWIRERSTQIWRRSTRLIEHYWRRKKFTFFGQRVQLYFRHGVRQRHCSYGESWNKKSCVADRTTSTWSWSFITLSDLGGFDLF